MQIRIVSDREEIVSLPETLENIHITFRPASKDIFHLVSRCPHIKYIQIAPSYRKSIAKSLEMYLSMNSIALSTGDVWGHRKDLSPTTSIPTIGEQITHKESAEISTIISVDSHKITIRDSFGSFSEISLKQYRAFYSPTEQPQG